MSLRNLGKTGAVALSAAALSLLAPQASAQSSGWQANDDDFLLLQLTVGKYQLDNEVRGYQTNTGICLDLADVIQSFDLPIRLDKKSRRATGWLFAEDQVFTLDREANTVQNMNTGTAPLSGEIHDTPEGWCVDLDALSRWFGIGLEADLYNSAIRIDDSVKLPFIEAIERRSRAARLRKPKKAFDLSQFPTADTEYRLWRTPSVDMNLRMAYSGGRGASKLTTRYEAYAAGEVGKVSYTARLASDNNLKPSALRFTAYRNNPAGTLLGPLKATQVAVGDVETLSGQLTGQTAVGRGAFVSNRPLRQTSRYSTTDLRGQLPAGWDAELYRNGQLIAFQGGRSDGRYEFLDIELFYGRNEFEVVLYGPQGQVRRIREDVPVGRNAIEPGKTYYWAGIVQDDRDLFELDSQLRPNSGHWRWGVGVERGLDERTSVAAGVQSIYLAGKRREYLEANMLRSFGAMQLALGGAYQRDGGVALQANALGRVGNFNLGADAVWVNGDFASEFIGSDLDYKLAFRADTSLKLGKLRLPVQAGVGRAQLKSGQKVTEWLIATAFNVFRTNVRAEVKNRTESGGLPGSGESDTRLKLLASRRMFGLTVRGGADFKLSGKDKGFQTARLSTAKALNEVSDINAEIEYDATAKDTRFGLGYSRTFKKFALRSDLTYSTRGAFGASLSLAFSLGPDPVNGGIRFSEKRLARNGQAQVTVFRDDNGDGVRGADEEVLKDVYVEAGLRETDAITNEQGAAMVDGLKPFVPILVGVDESTLGDPYLVPAVKGVVVVPRPGISAVVEIPVTSSGEVEGVLLSPEGIEQPGVELELVDAKGAVVDTTLTEFDGFFLFEKVPYGRYRLRVAPDSARALGVREALAAKIEVSREEDIARAGVLKLQSGGATVATAVAPPAPAGSAP